MDLETRHLQQLLSTVPQPPEVLLLKPITTSTNDDVREIAKKGIQHVLVCSEEQTQGRGQRDHQWVSPVGNIYLSTLLNLQTAIDGRLALEIALNILQMPSLQNLALQVKWPNDLYSPQGKWGGILIEPISPHQAIVGVGMNLFPIPSTGIEQRATSLYELGLHSPNRLQLIAELYAAIQLAGEWFDHNCYNLAARFNHYAAFMQQPVELEHLQGKSQGLFLGIENDGSINIQTSQRLENHFQGRLRLADQS
ncbi:MULTISPECIES: biotin--[acetyl-CoA-carboxylase] ligase [unclassified Acinetobacter]|uniref:biotin--[acetyl-CoA-carboxylase] ligase n=1 Tax=unclassified Acinetobacter TaxID=196816 RepID=UPI0015D15C85|nr:MULTISPECIES: biotin--[acetyl-CoA-carboxylase] ligase [unclassified Acinetobacter]